MKKKVGVLTFHRAINYGASLQALALQNYILENTNLDVKQIDYEEKFITDGSKVINIRKENILRSLVGTIYRFPATLVRNLKFKKFWKEFLNFSNKYDQNSSEIDFDYYIVGSDQVWNFDITNNDDTFFFQGNRFTNGKKISYAASIGKSNLSLEEKKQYFSYLKNFDSISVREESGRRLLEEAGVKNIDLVLDPTLLLNKEDWQKLISKKRLISEPYVLIYLLEENELVNEMLSNYFEKNKKKRVVRVSSSIDVHRIKNTYNPIEFLNLFYYADFIITNSFHGTAFSINFNKNFVTIAHKSRASRMVDFLNLCGLDERLVEKNEDIKKVPNTISFENANKILEEERIKSSKFIIDSLE